MQSHFEERPHLCEVCGSGFKTEATLRSHENKHKVVKPHVCKECSRTFTTRQGLVRHVSYKHTPHRCTECDYASVELSKLRRHERCHTGERPYQCPHCTYAAPDALNLKRHLHTHTGEKPYKCEDCSMTFSQSNSLKAHRLRHKPRDERPVYECDLCPAKYLQKANLRKHLQKFHTSDKSINCKRCGKSFPDRYSCKMHYKTHTGEKPFKCQHCDKSFWKKQLLRRHLALIISNTLHNSCYVPLKEKYSCHVCTRSYERKGNLVRHLAVHDPPSGHPQPALPLLQGQEELEESCGAEVGGGGGGGIEVQHTFPSASGPTQIAEDVEEIEASFEGALDIDDEDFDEELEESCGAEVGGGGGGGIEVQHTFPSASGPTQIAEDVEEIEASFEGALDIDDEDFDEELEESCGAEVGGGGGGGIEVQHTFPSASGPTQIAGQSVIVTRHTTIVDTEDVDEEDVDIDDEDFDLDLFSQANRKKWSYSNSRTTRSQGVSNAENRSRGDRLYPGNILGNNYYYFDDLQSRLRRRRKKK